MKELILPDPTDKRARSKAFAIRKKLPRGNALSGEADWLREYDQKVKPPGNNAARATAARVTEARSAPPDPPEAPASTFASGSSKKIVHMEEHHQAVQATGDPAIMAAAMAAAHSREEGRRYDYLLEAAVGSQRFVIEQLLKRNGELEKAQIAMMEAIRAQYVARTQAEIDGMLAAADAKKEAEEAASGTDEAKAMKFMEQLHSMLPMLQGFMGRGAAAAKP